MEMKKKWTKGRMSLTPSPNSSTGIYTFNVQKVELEHTTRNTQKHIVRNNVKQRHYNLLNIKLMNIRRKLVNIVRELYLS